MDTTEAQETTAKDGRGKGGDIELHIKISYADYKAIRQSQLKRVKQTGKEVRRDEIISEAIQHYAKGDGGQE